VIDIDRLDEQLEAALDEDLRVLRRALSPPPEPATAEPPPTPEPPPPPAAVIPTPVAAARPASVTPVPRVQPAPRPPAPRPPAPRSPAPTPPAPPRVASRPVARRQEPRLRPRTTRGAGFTLPTFEKAAPSTAVTTDPRRPVAQLLRDGRVDEARRQIRVSAADPREAAALATMLALFEGRHDDARRSAENLRMLASAACDAEGLDRYWLQRFWLALDWGDSEERYEVLDYCRERAYRYDDLSWRGRLTLLLARLGRLDEARREIETAFEMLGRIPQDHVWLDVATDLAETAALLGDARVATALARSLAKERPVLVVVGGGWICKGSLARYRGLLAAMLGDWRECDTQFGIAVDASRAFGARPALARALAEWGGSLQDRDERRARSCLQESSAVAAELGLTAVSLVQSAQAS
jgi:tetratricopeptide (TPR) repeat protein